MDRSVFSLDIVKKKQAIQPLSFTLIHSKVHNEQTFCGIVFVQYRNIEDAGVVRLSTPSDS